MARSTPDQERLFQGSTNPQPVRTVHEKGGCRQGKGTRLLLSDESRGQEWVHPAYAGHALFTASTPPRPLPSVCRAEASAFFQPLDLFPLQRFLLRSRQPMPQPSVNVIQPLLGCVTPRGPEAAKNQSHRKAAQKSLPILRLSIRVIRLFINRSSRAKRVTAVESHRASKVP